MAWRGLNAWQESEIQQTRKAKPIINGVPLVCPCGAPLDPSTESGTLLACPCCPRIYRKIP